MSKKVVRLGHLLTAVAGRIELFDREHDVLPINAEEWQLVEEMGQGSGSIRDAVRMTGRLVPTLTEAELGQLTAEIIGEIVMVSKGLVAEVEPTIPFSSGETTASPTSESPAT